ncbi:hypothetical protein [Acinetobacter lwoffii]|uniref:hypothetical protein n=1 Tax=Acinetobacter lwoffii TaxID=28090 RepID=UPI003BF6BB6C
MRCGVDDRSTRSDSMLQLVVPRTINQHNLSHSLVTNKAQRETGCAAIGGIFFIGVCSGTAMICP